MSNYLRGGCAKRWDALINQGKSKNRAWHDAQRYSAAPSSYSTNLDVDSVISHFANEDVTLESSDLLA